MKKNTGNVADLIKRGMMIVVAAIIMAVNLKTLVRTGNLIPGGFTGLTRLIQQLSVRLWDVEPPFAPINLLLNAVPIAISYKFIGKHFTIYSCMMVLLSGVITDLVPSYVLVTDPLLVSVFGGLINAMAVAITLFAGATSGGTDFIAIFLSEKYNMDSWNYIFAFNVLLLLAAGFLFGWEEALYSIIFQFTCTQVINMLHKRYQKQTFLIITEHPEDVYQTIREATNHDATLFKGIGCYRKKECNMIYSVVGRDEVRTVLKCVQKADSKAFINMIKTENLAGNFYMKPND